MTQHRRVLTIFASSPSDVVEERQQLSEVVQELNLLWSRFLRFQIDLLQDSTHTFPGVGDYAQDVVNRQIGDDYDIYLGIMGNRFGSPTMVARSGTEEEFNRALSRYHSGHSAVEIMFFFRRPRRDDSTELDQRRQVEEFRQRLDEQGIYYRWYRTIPDFTALIRLSLTLALQEWLRRNNTAILAVTPAATVDAAASQEEAREAGHELIAVIYAMNAVVGRLQTAIGSWNADVAAAKPFEDILAHTVADLATFSRDLKSLAPRFAAEYLRLLDSASRVASQLAVPHENRKIALTILLISLHLTDSKRAEAHQGLISFHGAVAGVRATSAALARALADALEAIEELISAFEHARDELGSAVATIKAIRDLDDP